MSRVGAPASGGLGASGERASLSISSMTGFACTDGRDDTLGWRWEVRSVNGRGLDIRCRMPPGRERLDPKVRAAVSSRLRRGSVTVALQLLQAPGAGAVRVNRALLDELIAVAAEYRGAEGVGEPRLDGLLALRGVIEPVEQTRGEARYEQREEAMLRDLDDALALLVRERRAEGAALAAVLADRIAEIESLTRQAEERAARRLAPMGERLRAQVAALIGAGAPLPEDRLAAELAVLAAKADVTEEIERLIAHCAAAARHLKEDGAVGRKLDFLAQEFNREANTLCAKASDAALTGVGLAIKSAVDRFREQVQNVE